MRRNEQMLKDIVCESMPSKSCETQLYRPWPLSLYFVYDFPIRLPKCPRRWDGSEMPNIGYDLTRVNQRELFFFLSTAW